MSDSAPLLTIGIPTWNRAAQLQQSLATILPQVEAAGGEVDVLVADNASPDSTPEVMLRLTQQHRCLRYMRNAENVGGDRNYVNLLRHSTGQYMWLFGDDDFMRPGAIAAVLDAIKRLRPSLLLTNFLYCDSHAQLRHYRPPQRYRPQKTLAGLDLDRLFLHGNHSVSFISRIVFRRDSIDIDDLEAKAEVYACWTQVYAVARIARDTRNACMLSYDAVLCRTGDTDRGTPHVMYADMPRMFSDILLSLGASRKVLDGVLRQIRHDMLPLRFYALFRLRGATDLPRVPLYYRLGYAVFGRSIIVAWKTYRLAHGRGFTLPPIY